MTKRPKAADTTGSSSDEPMGFLAAFRDPEAVSR